MKLRWPIVRMKTVKIADCVNPCHYCEGPTYLAAHTDSDGVVEMIIVKCQKCGEIKRLYRDKPNFEMTLKRARLIAENS